MCPPREVARTVRTTCGSGWVVDWGTCLRDSQLIKLRCIRAHTQVRPHKHRPLFSHQNLSREWPLDGTLAAGQIGLAGDRVA